MSPGYDEIIAGCESKKLRGPLKKQIAETVRRLLAGRG